METWTVVGVDTAATEKNKATGEVRQGVKLYLVGKNFEASDEGRFLGEVVSALFMSHEERKTFGFDPMPGDQIRVAYNRWGRLSLLEKVF